MISMWDFTHHSHHPHVISMALWMVTGKNARPQYGFSPSKEDMWLESVSTWPRGSLPTPEMLADLLRAEQAQDVRIIDAGTG